MSGQLFILSLIAMIVIIVVFVLGPILDYASDTFGRGNLLDETVNDVSAQLFNSMNNAQDPNESKIIQEIKAANPQFSYYLKYKNTEYLSSPEVTPKWANNIGNNELVKMSEKFSSVDNCATLYFSLPIRNEAGAGIIFMEECGDDLIYFEIFGINQPLSIYTTSIYELFDEWAWDFSQEYIVIVGSLLTLALAVIFFTSLTVRKLAKLTASLDPKQLNINLPEKGLPLEVLPLVQALNQLLRRVGDAKKQQDFFLSTAAHEIRTPLTILRTRLEELPDIKLKTQLREDTKRLIQLSNQLLKLMHINSKQQLNDNVELHTTLKKVIAERAPRAIEKNIDMVLESEVETFQMRGDQALIEVALVNLIDNAVSLSKAGDTIFLNLKKNGTIEIIDEGPGISEKIADKLFQPFAKNPPNRDGHGLGLAIVKAIINLHNGHINVTNQPNKGAKFTLNLPAH